MCTAMLKWVKMYMYIQYLSSVGSSQICPVICEKIWQLQLMQMFQVKMLHHI